MSSKWWKHNLIRENEDETHRKKIKLEHKIIKEKILNEKLDFDIKWHKV